MMMFLGATSSRSSSGSLWRRVRLRSAMATAFLALSCPMMYLSSSATISRGVSSLPVRSGMPVDFMPAPPRRSRRSCRCRCPPRCAGTSPRSPARSAPRRPGTPAPPRRRSCPPDPMAMTPSSGSITSPVPEIRNVAFLSATRSRASRRRRILSVRQSLASSTAARVMSPPYSFTLPSKRSKRVKASAVAPANPTRTLPS